MNRNKLIKQITQAVEEMKTYHHDGTYHWILGRDDDKNDWAIVLGWQDGYEPYSADKYMDGTYRLCIKLAYQSNKSMLQCDYDVDWLMPYDKETREVIDTEFALNTCSNLEKIINWLLDVYESLEEAA